MNLKQRIAAIVATAAVATATYTLSPSAEDKLVQFEGERFTSYIDTGGIYTIGVGSTGSVAKGDKITKEESRLLLRDDLRASSKALERNVKRPITSQNQVDAAIHWLHNFGEGNFRKSTLLKKWNAGDCVGTAKEFLKWDKLKVWDKKQQRYVTVINAHQVERRKWEHDQFLLGCSPTGGFK